LDDARALLALAQRVSSIDADALGLGDTRLRFALEQLEQDGSPLMQGAGGAVRVLLGHLDAEAFGELMGSWVDAGAGLADQSVLARRLAGALAMAAPLLAAAPAVTEPLIARIGGLSDRVFLRRLPALREGFEVLSPAARERFLSALGPSLSPSFDPRLEHPAGDLARWAEADLHAREAVLAQVPEALSA